MDGKLSEIDGIIDKACQHRSVDIKVDNTFGEYMFTICGIKRVKYKNTCIGNNYLQTFLNKQYDEKMTLNPFIFVSLKKSSTK